MLVSILAVLLSPPVDGWKHFGRAPESANTWGNLFLDMLLKSRVLGEAAAAVSSASPGGLSVGLVVVRFL